MTHTSFREEVEFLSRHTDLVILDTCRPALVAVAPAYQGRVMTSTTGGESGRSLGWVNRNFIESSDRGQSFDNYGGEDRFWMGPEGGQYSLWFKKGEPFDIAHWRTPAGFNTGAFSVTSQGSGGIAFASRFDLTNTSGTRFEVAVRRVVSVLNAEQAAECLGLAIPIGVSWVGFQSSNTVANVGATAWKKDGGLLSVWILGQFNPLPRGLVIVPFHSGPKKDLGAMPNGEYFGPIGEDRFRVLNEHALFRCDGRYRSKLGISPQRSRNILGSFDPDASVLTVVQFNLPSGAGSLPYVNSLWKRQSKPFAGDAVNSYNDGEQSPGAGQMGPFYEIETSSYAPELGVHESVTHVHRTMHFSGPREKLNALALGLLGIDLDSIPFPQA